MIVKTKTSLLNELQKFGRNTCNAGGERMPSSSGLETNALAKPLLEYFGYLKMMKLCACDIYTAQQWDPHGQLSIVSFFDGSSSSRRLATYLQYLPWLL